MLLVSERMVCLENAMCCTTEDRFSAEAEAFEYRNVQIHTQIQEKKAVGFLTDKFYIVVLCLGTGTKMYGIKNSRSFCTVDNLGHF